VRIALSWQPSPSKMSSSYELAWSAACHVNVAVCGTPSAPSAGELRVGPVGDCERMTTCVVDVVGSPMLAACTVSVEVPGGVIDVREIRIAEDEPLTGGVGTGFGSNVAVISPPAGGVGLTAVTLSVTGLTKRPAPPWSVTVAIAVVPRHASPALVIVIGVA